MLAAYAAFVWQQAHAAAQFMQARICFYCSSDGLASRQDMAYLLHFRGAQTSFVTAEQLYGYVHLEQWRTW